MENPGGFSSLGHKDEKGTWVVKIEYRIGTTIAEDYRRSVCEDLKFDFKT